MLPRPSDRCAVLLGLALVSCGDPPVTRPPQVPRAKVHLRAFTETTPVRGIVALGREVFVDKGAAVERWRADGTLVELSAAHGLPGGQVLAMAGDHRRGRVWIATDGGLVYYDTKADTLEIIPTSPIAADLGLAPRAASPPDGPPPEPAAPPPATPMPAAAAADDGVWLGHARGLFYVSRRGGWTSTPITDPVTALHADARDWLWIGTDRGLIGRDPGGQTVAIGHAQGCDVVSVRWIVDGPGAAVMAVGEDRDGHQRIAIGAGGQWRSFKLSPSTRWLAGTATGGRVVVAASDGLYAVSEGPGPAPAPLQRDGVRLLPVAGADGPALRIERLPATLPGGARVVAADERDLLIGTDDLGVARQPIDSAQPLGWLRRAAMLDHASSLTVLCSSKDDCWVATGAPRAWHWQAGRFTPAGPVDDVVLALVRSRDGKLYAFHRPPLGNEILLSAVDGDTWSPLPVQLVTPGARPEVSFAKASGDGSVWVGLRYRDADDDLRPWGIAAVDLDTGVVAYHHASLDTAERKLGVLPVPTSVVDVAFLGSDEVWMASHEGAARLDGIDLTVWNEGAQLESELLNAVAVSTGGLVFVASDVGVGTFDGERWRFPPALHFPTHDLGLDRAGRLWLATDRGLAIYDGKRVRRLDVRRGMIENQVLDVAIDDFGRVWTRGPGSLAVITP
ncbi:MAG: hypothetical protein R3B06_09550 [Kofleriaceae bacterium]